MKYSYFCLEFHQILFLAVYKIQMAAHNVARGARHGPSLIKEIVYGISLSLTAGYLWKLHHWNIRRKYKEFYDLLERGEISVVVEDE